MDTFTDSWATGEYPPVPLEYIYCLCIRHLWQRVGRWRPPQDRSTEVLWQYSNYVNFLVATAWHDDACGGPIMFGLDSPPPPHLTPVCIVWWKGISIPGFPPYIIGFPRIPPLSPLAARPAALRITISGKIALPRPPPPPPTSHRVGRPPPFSIIILLSSFCQQEKKNLKIIILKSLYFAPPAPDFIQVNYYHLPLSFLSLFISPIGLLPPRTNPIFP